MDNFLRKFLRYDALTDSPSHGKGSMFEQIWIAFQYTIIKEITTGQDLDKQNPFRNRLRIF
jgi:hypothetical protein